MLCYGNFYARCTVVFAVKQTKKYWCVLQPQQLRPQNAHALQRTHALTRNHVWEFHVTVPRKLTTYSYT